MDEIIIGFSTYKSFSVVSALIRTVERTPYSHVYTRFFADSIDRWLIYQASDDELNFMNLPHFQSKNKIVYEYAIPVTPEMKRQVIQFCVDNVSRPYGRLNLVGIAMARVARFAGFKIGNPFHDGKRTQICSELTGYILAILGFDIDPKVLEIEGPSYIHSVVSAIPAARLLQQTS